MNGEAAKPFFSLIIPVYNRPSELAELLESIQGQTFVDFEVLIIEDGSAMSSKAVVDTFAGTLPLAYYWKPNSGQGFSRNYGFERARGEFFIILDSDVLLPAGYLAEVYKGLSSSHLDAFGGPDAAHESFSKMQKAISYAMTSIFTTGGIRGGSEKNLGGAFHPRSFNMGMSRKVYIALGGFKITRLGEDIEYSLRIQQAGFKSALLPQAFVYHKRRSDLIQFWKQTHFFGRARINIYTFYPSGLKAVHFFPAIFTLSFIFTLVCIPFLWFRMFLVGASLFLLYSFCLLLDSYARFRSISVAILSVEASWVQLVGYGSGFMTDFFKRLILRSSGKA